MKNVRHSVVLVAVVALVTLAVPSLASAAEARRSDAPSHHQWRHHQVGGRCPQRQTLHLSSSPTVAGFDGTTTCTNGRAVRPATFKRNTSTEVKDYTLTVVIRGVTTTVDHLKVVQAQGKERPLGSPPRTASDHVAAVTCYRLRRFRLASLEIGYVDSNVVCPDPGVCDQPAVTSLT